MLSHSIIGGLFLVKLFAANPSACPSSTGLGAQVGVGLASLQITIDGKTGSGFIVDDLFPTIRIKLPGRLTDYDLPAALSIAFTKRPDGVVPKMDLGAVLIDRKTLTITYQVPFRQDTALEGGDQSIGVSLRNKQGRVLRQVVKFAVGGHTKFRGVNGLSEHP